MTHLCAKSQKKTDIFMNLEKITKKETIIFRKSGSVTFWALRRGGHWEKHIVNERKNEHWLLYRI